MFVDLDKFELVESLLFLFLVYFTLEFFDFYVLLEHVPDFLCELCVFELFRGESVVKSGQFFLEFNDIIGLLT